MDEPAVEMQGVSHRYGSELVLRQIDLTIEHGEIFGFLGHNGAGKTTAINILTTLLVPSGGNARVYGHDVVTARRKVTERIGYLPSDVRLYDHMTATENLEFFAKLSGVSDPRMAAAETLDYLDSSELGPRRLSTFSTGMRQRIGIAQAIGSAQSLVDT